jgi:hypothetical protein
MSGRGGRVDKRIAHAVTFKIHCRDASIPEAMRATEFTLSEFEPSEADGRVILVAVVDAQLLALASTPLSLLSVTIAVSVAIPVLVIPFYLIVVFSPTAIAVAAVVFIALPLPLLSPLPMLPPLHLPSP